MTCSSMLDRLRTQKGIVLGRWKRVIEKIEFRANTLT